MILVSKLIYVEFGPIDHREDGPHFRLSQIVLAMK